jgi:hypothetical protein
MLKACSAADAPDQYDAALTTAHFVPIAEFTTPNFADTVPASCSKAALSSPRDRVR